MINNETVKGDNYNNNIRSLDSLATLNIEYAITRDYKNSTIKLVYNQIRSELVLPFKPMIHHNKLSVFAEPHILSVDYTSYFSYVFHFSFYIYDCVFIEQGVYNKALT